MTSLHRSILSTLALHSAESHPYLTIPELYDCLHKDASEKDARPPTLREVAHAVSELAHGGKINAQNGFFALAGSAPWQEGTGQTEKKLAQARYALALLKIVPFVRAIAVTGSVSFGNAKEASDLDLFILTKRGRVWTVRLLALAVLELLGKRRDRAAKTGKICLNYFMAESAKPPVQNVASATMFKRALPVFGTRLFFDFISRNAWMKNFLYRPEHDKKEGTSRLQATSSSTLSSLPKGYKLQAGFKSIGELFLAGATGAVLERLARSWQEKRLLRKKTGKANAEHFILADDVIMLHHPNSKNKEVMARYRRIMAGLKL
ncbi:hypothetical protein A3C91_00090 [Candidatus Azambacteria bacterium RIFCSPHIGHO2_02_FULL_52_12]|uniref:Polymerase nucleotidyl transferase domain-containing protein n=1 Tax=Candidatus Azambacteria bacterium RIFCSPLOWO2_01_FULL_46_25 TaxID=1797298 RepID=A0A1F5BUQ8_9BACT|nr:MAG: hypothetical protein A3C91_00090 [Candidatus Azambacteria bacterium RIFCSPHIGHO2_02_FULL_52_12]OGD34330.1 MAG: hypothetical protein A2988_02270 [Candidatus Azambacteria bacterium RIFCSPLOWO2_01_FULL_46_25]OGD37392.1 MAG: hypothetical protein A2850_01615 [Candidatus Azambacteria bacterium RIFCSPHIGHO2_01_FULL_51_74]